MAKHHILQHGPANDVPFLCTLCDARLWESDRAQNHYERVHPNVGLSFSEMFTGLMATPHLDVEEEEDIEAAMKCDHCSFHHSVREYLVQHYLVKHAPFGEVPYVCMLCPWRGCDSALARNHRENEHPDVLFYLTFSGTKKQPCVQRNHWKKVTTNQLKQMGAASRVEAESSSFDVTPGSWVCNYCAFHHTSRKIQVKHFILTHASPSEMPFVCKFCKWRGFTAGEAHSHRQKSHRHMLFDVLFAGTRKPPQVAVDHCRPVGVPISSAITDAAKSATFECKHCKFRHSSQGEMMKHYVLNHAPQDEVPYLCINCDARMCDRQMVERHRQKKHADLSLALDDLFIGTHKRPQVQTLEWRKVADGQTSTEKPLSSEVSAAKSSAATIEATSSAVATVAKSSSATATAEASAWTTGISAMSSVVTSAADSSASMISGSTDTSPVTAVSKSAETNAAKHFVDTNVKSTSSAVSSASTIVTSSAAKTCSPTVTSQVTKTSAVSSAEGRSTTVVSTSAATKTSAPVSATRSYASVSDALRSASFTIISAAPPSAVSGASAAGPTSSADVVSR